MRPKEQRVSELRKALVTTGSGQYLIAEDLEPLIRENLLELSPLTDMVPVIQATGKTHEVARRTATPGGARAEGEMTPVAYTQSTYDRRTVVMKILRAAGQVSDFQQSAARSFTDCLADEIDAQTEDMADSFEFHTIYGCADDTGFTGDAYRYSGVYPYILYDDAANCCRDAGGDTITLTDLDGALNQTKNKYRNLRNVRYVWLMSPSMISKISGLETRIQRMVPTIDYEGKFTMALYDTVPMLPSGFVQPDGTAAPTSLTGASGVLTGGTIADATYYYGIASITTFGEQLATTGVSVVVSGGAGAGSVTLSWTADSNALLYAIYRTGGGEADSAANYDLIDIIAAYSYDSVGTATAGGITTYNDLGALTAKTTCHPLSTGEEVIFLVGLGENQGVARPMLNPTLGEPMDDLIRFVPLVETTDSYQFRLKTYHALQVPWGKVHAVIRRAKPS